MKGCGTACSFLTVNTKSAVDISKITFYGNEKEQLMFFQRCRGPWRTPLAIRIPVKYGMLLAGTGPGAPKKGNCQSTAREPLLSY